MFNEVNIFEKEEFYGVIARDFLDLVDLIGKSDNKNRQISKKPFTDIQESDLEYKKTLQLTHQNGWNLVYRGERNWG